MFSFAKNDLFALMMFDIDTLTQVNEMQLKLLLILAAKADLGLNYICSPTQEELAQISGWSRPTVQSVINSLLEVKIDGKQVVTVKKEIKQGGGFYNVYSVNCYKAPAK